MNRTIRISASAIDPHLFSRMSKKAAAGPSQYHLSVAAFDKKGDLLGVVSNSFRRDRIAPVKYSGAHAEMRAIHRWGPKIKTLLLMRIGNKGDVLPIDCCPKCAAVLAKMGIKAIALQ
jgi:hypothetical protein